MLTQPGRHHRGCVPPAPPRPQAPLPPGGATESFIDGVVVAKGRDGAPLPPGEATESFIELCCCCNIRILSPFHPCLRIEIYLMVRYASVDGSSPQHSCLAAAPGPGYYYR